MCCNINREFSNDKIAKLKAKGIKSIVGYKLLFETGVAGIRRNYKYSAGTHTMKRLVKRYNKSCPKGFHFYTTRLCAQRKLSCSLWKSNLRLIKIQVPVSSIIGFERDYYDFKKMGKEGVSNSIVITKEAWKKAKLK